MSLFSLRLTFPGVVAAVVVAVIATACSSTKHVPEGEYLLDDVSIEVTDRNDIDKVELYNFLRQQPNHRVPGFARLQLSTYSLSGRDTTKWYNRWLRRIGQPPVIYDSALTEASRNQLRLAMVNSGFSNATVEADTLSKPGSKRMDVVYRINAGDPLTVSDIRYNIPDSTLRRIIMGGAAEADIHPGMLLDRNVLENERGRITRNLRNAGFYDFNREFITYTADTVEGSRDVALTLGVHAVARKSIFVLDNSMGRTPSGAQRDTMYYNDISVIYGSDHYLTPKLLDEMCYIQPGKPYSARDVERTYEALGRLSVVIFINIRSPTYQDRNLANGAQLLTAKFRASYESLSGNFDGLINKRYTEYAGEVGITFPKFECPFVSKAYRQRRLASTGLTVSGNYQERPEYTRIIFGTAWKWKWQQIRRSYTRRQSIDLIDINYVRLPKSTLNFIDQIAPTNPLLRYS